MVRRNWKMNKTESVIDVIGDWQASIFKTNHVALILGDNLFGFDKNFHQKNCFDYFLKS